MAIITNKYLVKFYKTHQTNGALNMTHLKMKDHRNVQA